MEENKNPEDLDHQIAHCRHSFLIVKERFKEIICKASLSAEESKHSSERAHSFCAEFDKELLYVPIENTLKFADACEQQALQYFTRLQLKEKDHRTDILNEEKIRSWERYLTDAENLGSSTEKYLKSHKYTKTNPMMSDEMGHQLDDFIKVVTQMKETTDIAKIDQIMHDYLHHTENLPRLSPEETEKFTEDHLPRSMSSKTALAVTYHTMG